MSLVLTPAYGRDYNSKDAVIADWNDGKDFIIANVFHPYSGKPISKRDVLDDTIVEIRYSKLRKLVVV
jgi:hypothetical protein